ncbi:hypothetical protein niasHS_010535 [Heterodera schachtii]|uniref:G protein-coupled receptor n=1 Tax=Heterodera schachtii TaxID=97005 RepID=A0ABD2J2N5_HETSC
MNISAAVLPFHFANNSSFSPEATPDTTVVALLVGTVVELLVSVMTVPFSTINLVVIGRSSLLHPNLKMVLLWQSAFILLRGIVRLLIGAHKLALIDPFGPEMFAPYRLLHVFTFFNRNFIAHVLLIERFMATAMVKTYETRRSWLFTSVWCTVVVSNGKATIATGILLTESFMLFFGIAEWLVFARLWRFNEQRYKLSIAKSEHSLSERFQLSENIRTGKQLTPTLSFHFWMLFASVFTAFWSYFDFPRFDQIYLAINVANGITGLIIETLMITCHPFLKRDALYTIHRIFAIKLQKNRVHDEGQAMKR